MSGLNGSQGDRLSSVNASQMKPMVANPDAEKNENYVQEELALK